MSENPSAVVVESSDGPVVLLLLSLLAASRAYSFDDNCDAQQDREQKEAPIGYDATLLDRSKVLKTIQLEWAARSCKRSLAFGCSKGCCTWGSILLKHVSWDDGQVHRGACASVEPDQSSLHPYFAARSSRALVEAAHPDFGQHLLHGRLRFHQTRRTDQW